MTNTPQSSRVAGAMNKSIFGNVGIQQLAKPTYFAEKTFTQAGENDIQIKQKERATLVNYIIGAAVVVGLIYFASTKLD